MLADRPHREVAADDDIISGGCRKGLVQPLQLRRGGQRVGGAAVLVALQRRAVGCGALAREGDGVQQDDLGGGRGVHLDRPVVVQAREEPSRAVGRVRDLPGHVAPVIVVASAHLEVVRALERRRGEHVLERALEPLVVLVFDARLVEVVAESQSERRVDLGGLLAHGLRGVPLGGRVPWVNGDATPVTHHKKTHFSGDNGRRDDAQRSQHSHDIPVRAHPKFKLGFVRSYTGAC
jgi:hypothetical protein